jgi:hypothetical protein
MTRPDPDPVPAVLDQLAAHADRLARVDAREASHHAALAGQLAELTALITSLAGDHSAVLTSLAALDERVAALAERFAEIRGTETGDQGGRPRRPEPPARWWKLHGPDRDQALDTLRAWVEQVYRPGYGKLAAALGPCWDQHTLCLYGLDIVSQLWSVLYLPAARTTAILSFQAEFQARILPAIAGQLAAETTRCNHTRNQASLNGHARSYA